MRVGVKPNDTGCKSVEMKKVQEKTPSPMRRGKPRLDGTRLPLLSSQSFQSHPPGLRDMLLRELPNKGLRDVLLLQEQTVGTNHHTLLTPREHDVRPSLVLHEPRGHSPDDRNDDVVCFVTLEGVDVEHGVFPGDSFGFEGVLDRVALGVVGCDDLEGFPF
jgi:hypothetical protein